MYLSARIALFDLESRNYVSNAAMKWVFGLRKPYGEEGDVKKVVFPCGYTIAPDDDIY
jgi:predicted GH43/DUF377 family glycosyl hydrolase